MKTKHTQNVREKIILLEAIEDIMATVEDRIGWYIEYDNDGNEIPPKEGDNLSRFNALHKILDHLNKLQ